MKRILSLMFLLMISLSILGCSTKGGNAQLELATQKLSSSLDKLIIATKNIDSVDQNQIDLSNDLGYYLDTDTNQIRNLSFLNKVRFDAPTPNKVKRINHYDLCDVKNNKRFYFISKEAEENYGNLYELSYTCVNIASKLIENKESLINNCILSKTLLHELTQSNTATNESDVMSLNSYNDVINSCIEKISSKMNLSDCVKNISNKRSNLLSNSTSMSADYLILANKLDSCCVSCEHANIGVNDLNRYLQKKLRKTDLNTNEPYLYNYRYQFNKDKQSDIPDAPLQPYYDEDGNLEKGRIIDKNDLGLDNLNEVLDDGNIIETNDEIHQDEIKAVNPKDDKFDGKDEGVNKEIIRKRHADEIYEKFIKPYRHSHPNRQQRIKNLNDNFEYRLKEKSVRAYMEH